MSDPVFRMLSPAPECPPALSSPPSRVPIGRHLVESGAITNVQLVRALEQQMRLSAPLGEILVAEGHATDEQVRDALARQQGVKQVDLLITPPDPDIANLAHRDIWLRHRAIPWARSGPVLSVATARPDRFEALRRDLPPDLQNLIPVLASEAHIMTALADRFSADLARAASVRVAPEFSCRGWTARQRLPLIATAVSVLVMLAMFPSAGLAILFLAATATLAMFVGLRGAGFVVHMLNHGPLKSPSPKAGDTKQPPQNQLPKVSMLVPLFQEREIAGDLIDRLNRLTYPKVLLDVMLVLEEKDTITRETLALTDLPPWIRVIEVPAHGGLTTKPRAMNYALDFCDGDIVGVWDAEDAPVPDQIERVVDRFAHVSEEVVCLQGILDFYNPRSSWRARCFTIEYSSWFRIILPGIARLGLVVPLGGTTLFFRRDKLEELGGWDAHNVTEDADLGVRLARAGYRTEMIDTVTFEEANFRAWPWIKQRSRWLKGFMVTYLVHMRAPHRLLRDLGTARFLGVQAFFLGTLGQFLLAPVLWSFWLVILGLDHPLQTVLPTSVLAGAAALFITAEVLGLAAGLAAVSASRRRYLIPFVPTMGLYFPLGVVAAYKALWELAFDPFFWDKTQHGHAGEEEQVA
ncbi:glycosyltransferase family 2 protein [Primorskyibacter sp. S87]|uniref:glycosyltransferase family 2 protein n=1 Tax=Primorskyibacter sp. S87 TaxID=3415126 RepID=UPI003C7BA51A